MARTVREPPLGGQYRMSWLRTLSATPLFRRGRQFGCIMISKYIIFVVINAVKRFLRKKELKNEIFY
jgi:hypothetical protein